MAEKGSYRSKYDEKDLSGYIVASGNETGAMVIKSLKGSPIPKYCTQEQDIFTRYGYPSASNPEVFEALSFIKQAPLWVASAIHEDALWGGVYVTADSVVAFDGGQVNPDNFVFTEVAVLSTETIGISDGVTKTFSATLTDTPINEFSLLLKRGSIELDATDADGDITGSDIASSGTIDYDTGEIAFTMNQALTSGDVVSANYTSNVDMSATISHAFLNASPCADDISLNIVNTSGSQYTLTITETATGNYITEYNYSLLREKDGFGANLYIFDIFNENDYVIPKVNTAYVGATPSMTATTIVDLGGGKRGSTPTVADRTTSWDYFKRPNKYEAKIFMDCTGEVADVIQNLIASYQYYSFGITVIPMNYTATGMVTYRGDLGIDSDNTALYCNWRKIYDPYNDSFAWISNVGSIGKKMAEMEDVYDGKSPAGTDDETGHGGQIRDWKTIEVELDFNDTELKLLDEAQINPVIYDTTGYGVMIYGDRTLQVSNTDTSFILTRRIDNYIIERVVRQVMRPKEFKNNTNSSQLRAKITVEQFLKPMVSKELITEVEVICSSINNTATTKTQRKFILDIIKKSTVNNQKTLLRLTRVGQGAVISEITPL